MNSDVELWQAIRNEASAHAEQEPILASYLHASILNHTGLTSALGFLLAGKLDSAAAPALTIREVVDAAHAGDPCLSTAAANDILASYQRDSACHFYSTPLLFYKGFQALQAYRVANWLWQQNRREMALFFQHAISVTYGVDIHPAAVLGTGIMIDHGTGIVIGETAAVGNNVSIMQSVTLGGTGKESGDRHPKIADCVLLGVGCKILGNIAVGQGSQVAPGSVVLKAVPEHTLVSGVPARVVGKPSCDKPALQMDQLNCGTR